MDVNLLDVVREVTAAFEHYEQALNDNDVATLNELFWDSPHTMRYGPTEELYSEPPKRLVGFRKIWLDPGEQIKVTVVIDPNATDRPLSYWEAGIRDWAITNGTYKVYLGGSAGDIAATGPSSSSAQRPRSRGSRAP